MKKLGYFASLSLLCLLTIVGSGRAFADPVTLTLLSTGQNQANNEYAYPYYLSVNGNTNSLMCLSYNNAISTVRAGRQPFNRSSAMSWMSRRPGC